MLFVCFSPIGLFFSLFIVAFFLLPFKVFLPYVLFSYLLIFSVIFSNISLSSVITVAFCTLSNSTCVLGGIVFSVHVAFLRFCVNNTILIASGKQ